MNGEQLALGVGLSDEPSFGNFWRGANALAVQTLEDSVNALAAGPSPTPAIFIHGSYGTGKSHLVSAALRHARSLGVESRLLVLDGCAALAQDPGLERAAYAAWETTRVRGGLVVAAARVAPGGIGFTLADLASRLAAGPVFALEALDDAGRREALKLRARRRGFQLPDEVIDYILARHARDSHALFGLLDRIDAESLAAQRKVTVPLMAELLRTGGMPTDPGAPRQSGT